MFTVIGSIVSAFITGLLALLGVIYTNTQSNKKVEQQILTAQQVTDVKLTQLKDAVEKHTTATEKIPVIEEKITTLETRVDKIESRVNQLDRRKA